MRLWKKALGWSTLHRASKHHLFERYSDFLLSDPTSMRITTALNRHCLPCSLCLRMVSSLLPVLGSEELRVPEGKTRKQLQHLQQHLLQTFKPRMWRHSEHGHTFKIYIWKSKIWKAERQTARKCWKEKLLSRSTETGVQALWQKLPENYCRKVAKHAFVVWNRQKELLR